MASALETPGRAGGGKMKDKVKAGGLGAGVAGAVAYGISDAVAVVLTEPLSWFGIVPSETFVTSVAIIVSALLAMAGSVSAGWIKKETVA